MVALILAMIGVATSALLGNILSQQLDNEVRDAANLAGSQLSRHPGDLGDATDAYTALQEGRGFPTGMVLIVQSSTGTDGAYLTSDNTVATLSNAQVDQVVSAFDMGQSTTTATIDGLGTYRVFSGRVPGSYVIAAGLPLSAVSATITQILTTVGLVTTGGLLVLAAIIALVIRGSLKPLRAVAATATRVAAQPLDVGDVSITERVPAGEADASDEIGRVGAALNTLLDHIDTSLAARQRNEERMRAFVADASHELRTPLAAIRGYSELSLRALSQAQSAGTQVTKTQLVASSAQSQQGLERIQAASLRMTTLVEDLLLLARLDEGKELVYGAVDLTRVVVDAMTDAQVAGPDHECIIDVP